MGEGHCCDGPIVLYSTVSMYLDLYIGTCHPLIVYSMYMDPMKEKWKGGREG